MHKNKINIYNYLNTLKYYHIHLLFPLILSIIESTNELNAWVIFVFIVEPRVEQYCHRLYFYYLDKDYFEYLMIVIL